MVNLRKQVLLSITKPQLRFLSTVKLHCHCNALHTLFALPSSEVLLLEKGWIIVFGNPFKFCDFKVSWRQTLS